LTSVKYTKSRPFSLDPAKTMSASRVNYKKIGEVRKKEN
jgi:hypothetical protein